MEIGPGRGALTSHLLERAKLVVAIEIDTVLVHYLEQKFRTDPRLRILNNDVMRVDLRQWGPVTVAGNLPYYITSPILERVLELGPLLERAVFLVQKEVADRIVSQPGSREYGYLSVQCQIFAEPNRLVDVPPEAFQPPPKVESSVVVLAPRARPLVEDVRAFLAFASLCFRHKRKTLRNNLAGRFAKELLATRPEAGMRAEQLSVAQLAVLHKQLTQVSYTEGSRRP